MLVRCTKCGRLSHEIPHHEKSVVQHAQRACTYLLLIRIEAQIHPQSGIAKCIAGEDCVEVAIELLKES